MNFRHIDVSRRQTCLGIRLLGRHVREARLIQGSVLAARQHAGADLDGALLGTPGQCLQEAIRTQQSTGSSVSDRRTHRPGQGPTDLAVSQYFLWRHGEPVLRLGVESTHRVVLGRREGNLLTCGTEGLHVISRLHRIGIHEEGTAPRMGIERLAGHLTSSPVVLMPLLGIQLIDTAFEDLERLGCVIRKEGLLNPHRQ